MLRREDNDIIIQCDECNKIEIRIKKRGIICKHRENQMAMVMASKLQYRWCLDKQGVLRFYCKECKDGTGN